MTARTPRLTPAQFDAEVLKRGATVEPSEDGRYAFAVVAGRTVAVVEVAEGGGGGE